MNFTNLIPGFLLLLMTACSDTSDVVQYSGKAQGTTFHITYQDADRRNLGREVEEIFQRVNKSMSVYDTNSIISRINNNTYHQTLDTLFINVLRRSKEISEVTGGAFDITVGPLVDVWGFGRIKSTLSDTSNLANLLGLVNYQNLILTENGFLKKKDSSIRLDVNGIAQGYTVDLLAEFLEGKNIRNYMIEVGGEVRVSGQNPKGEPWRIGIDKPAGQGGNARPLQAIVTMKQYKSMATSGNYRKFYMKDGKKYAHTISPFTGKPVSHNLLSVSVFAPDCMTADAYATAFMVLGYEKSVEIIRKENDLAAFFILADKEGGYKTIITEGSEADVQKVEEYEGV